MFFKSKKLLSTFCNTSYQKCFSMYKQIDYNLIAFGNGMKTDL